MPKMPSSLQVKIKHNGKLHDVTLDPSAGAAAFRTSIHNVTGVPPDRQKLMLRPGQFLKEDTDLATAWSTLKQGHTFMLIGTAGPLPQAPQKQTVFVEDMTDSELALATREKAGLTNLGNTCYLNSTLQVLRAIPELQVALGRFGANMGGMDGESNLTASLRDLYKSMNESSEAFPPLAFLTILRQVAPQFAEMARGGPGGMGGGYAQQDAEEVWIRIINALQNSLPGLPAPEGNADSRKFVQQYMTGEMTVKRSCPEAPSEEPTVSKDTFTMLQCNIGMTTNDMMAGISDSLTQQIEKTSPTLGRTAVYDESSRVSRLPAYLACHFVRFYWRRDINKKTKIMRKVKFPFDLDATPFLSDELKEKVKATRLKILEIEKSRDERSKIRRRVKAKRDNENAAAAVGEPAKDQTATASADAPKPAADASGAMAVDTTEEKLPKDGAEGASSSDGPQLGAALSEEEEFALRDQERAEVQSTIHPDILKDVGANSSALYELVGIVTHKGAAADAGHYISWVKRSVADEDASVLSAIPGASTAGAEAKRPSLAELDRAKTEEWYKFDDDKVSTVSKDKITMLDGGGEDSVAYILLYRSKRID